MIILKFVTSQLKEQFSLNKVKNTNIIEKDNIVYAAYYKDMGSGYSDVECIIKTLYNKQEYFFDVGVKIPNALIENDKPVIVPINNQGKDGIAFVFPEGQNSGKKKFSTLSCNFYQIDIKPDSIKVTPSGEKIYLSNNAKISHSGNKYHNYSKPRAIELPNGDIIVAAVDSNSEGQYVTAWLLEKEQEFEVNEGPSRGTNRLLFKVNKNVENDFQFLPADQNNNVGKIIYSDSASFFSLDITKSMVDNIKDGKYINNEDEECLFSVGKERCDQFDKKVSSPFLTANKVSNLTAVNSESGAIITFLEDGQQLSLVKSTGKKGEKPKKYVIYNYEERIKSLQLTITNKDSAIISATGEKNIIQSSINLNNLNKVATKDFSINEVKVFSDFVDIIYNKLSELTTAFSYTVSTTVPSDELLTSSEVSTTPNNVISPSTTPALTTTKTTTTKGSTSTEAKSTSAATTFADTTTQHTTAKPKTTQPFTTTKQSATETTTQSTITTLPSTTSKSITTTSNKPTMAQTTKTTRMSSTARTAQSTTKPIKTTKSTEAVTTNRHVTSVIPTTSTKRESITTVTSASTSLLKTTKNMDSTTMESTTASTAALSLTTLASTIGSAVISTLGLVTQNTTLTTDNYPMITDNSSDFNQTDASPDFEARSLSTAEISAAVAVPIVIVIGMSCLVYRYCCRSNMRLPSDYTDDIGNSGFSQWFKSCFNNQRRTTNEIVLESLGNETRVTIDKNGISNSQSNSQDNPLSSGQGGSYGTTNPTFSSVSDSGSEIDQRSRSSSQEWDHNADIDSVQYQEEDETTYDQSISSNESIRSSGDGASLTSSDSEMLNYSGSNSNLNSEVKSIVNNSQPKPACNIGSFDYTYNENNGSSKLTGVKVGSIKTRDNETTV